jgi:16S rRNA G966 N2-methylase RsmD
MFLIHSDELRVAENRQRREFDPQGVMELADSISRLGLMHPLVVRPGTDGEASLWVLVAGERRLRAIRQLRDLGGEFRCGGEAVPEGRLPVTNLGELDSLDAYEAELEENIRRMDLTWQERAEAVSSLHRLRLARNPAQTTGDTAREVYDIPADVPPTELGEYRANVHKSLAITKHMDDPDIAKAKTLKEAFKILEAKENAEKNAVHAAIVGETFGAHLHHVYLGDCIDWMNTIDPGQFDVICTDPPYGMDADDFGDSAGRMTAITHEYSDSELGFRSLMKYALPLISRLAKPQAHMYICCDIDQFVWLRDLINSGTVGMDWNAIRTPLINYKQGGGRVPLPEHGPRRSYELVLYAFRGGKRVTAIYPDVIESKGDDNLGHGAQKPVNLYTSLLVRSVRAGDRILDPFAGTGTIFPAAHALKCSALGIEKDPSYYGIAVQRIEELK